jgi:polyhydroxyalkanoate synthesis regulator phasin
VVEPENHTLVLLRDIRGMIEALETKVDRNHEDLKGRIDSVRQAMLGESVLGRYAAAEFEERMAALEGRVAALERR